jgi:hypothetical protein
LLEKHVETKEAAIILGQVIGAGIGAKQQVTGVRVTVPHYGRLGDLYDTYRRSREFTAPASSER